MPITETEWKEHHQKFGTQSIETMSIEDDLPPELDTTVS